MSVPEVQSGVLQVQPHHAGSGGGISSAGSVSTTCGNPGGHVAAPSSITRGPFHPLGGTTQVPAQPALPLLELALVALLLELALAMLLLELVPALVLAVVLALVLVVVLELALVVVVPPAPAWPVSSTYLPKS
jgi:hypothetical protein